MMGFVMILVVISFAAAVLLRALHRKLGAPIARAVTGRRHSQFEHLVRHLLDRFFNNDMVSIGGDPLPLIMTIACSLAVPTVFWAVFAYPSYHAFPPHPHTPDPWHQAGDHYFFVVYSFVIMGAITVFEWDLLFPNLLDIFVLSPLPIAHRRLLLARITAVLIFLVLFLLGTSAFGTVLFPAISELPGARHFLAHLLAVTEASAFSAALFLALQGLLLNLLGGRLFRSASTLIQSLSMTVLLTVLFLFPILFRSLELLISSHSLAVRSFPPFWFLAIYECTLAGSARLPAFAALARTGHFATLLVVLLTVVTYPIAYRRKTRLAIEGSFSRDNRSRLARPFLGLLHATLLRTPSRRAVHHFISQSLLRTQRHRIYLAMYLGLGAALIAACSVAIQVSSDGRLRLALSTYGLRLAVPALAFWIVAGLGTALASPSDPAGSWVFHVILGKPSADHLAAARNWVLLWASVITLGATAALHLVAPPDLRGWQATAGQLLIAAAFPVLLSDAFFLRLTTIPFTEARIPLNTDLAFVLLRYIVVFPASVYATVQCEPWIEARPNHLLTAALLVVAAHRAMLALHRRLLQQHTAQPEREADDQLYRPLGLHP